MEEIRSVFIATDELHTSPMIQRYASLFDVSLTLGQNSLLSFIVPYRGSEAGLHRTLIHFNADLMDILQASVYTNKNKRTATLTLTIEPRDVGVTSLTISTADGEYRVPKFTAYVPQVLHNKPMR